MASEYQGSWGAVVNETLELEEKGTHLGCLENSVIPRQAFAQRHLPPKGLTLSVRLALTLIALDETIRGGRAALCSAIIMDSLPQLRALWELAEG